MRPIKKTSLEPLTDNAAIKNVLIDECGYYCAYCEITPGGHEVEHLKYHKLWKEDIRPDDWNDSMLICADCRNHISKEVLAPEEQANMLWPDEAPTFGLHENSPFIYQKQTVTYRVMNEDKVVEEEQKELVFIRANKNLPKNIYTKAVNTINHFQLNMSTSYYNDKEPNVISIPLYHHLQVRDNRVFERTRAWKKAEESIQRYKQVEAITKQYGLDHILQGHKEMMKAEAYHKGNWSIWMTVFWQEFKDKELLTELFISDQRYFKGIATDQIFPQE